MSKLRSTSFFDDEDQPTSESDPIHNTNSSLTDDDSRLRSTTTDHQPISDDSNLIQSNETLTEELLRHWSNERLAPEVLYHQEPLLESALDRIKQQVVL